MINYKLKLVGKVSDVIIKELGIIFSDPLNVFFADFAEKDIPLQTKFDLIKDQNGKIIPTCLKIIKVTQQFGKEFSEIPSGWKTIVELKPLDKMPLVLSTMKKIDDWYDSKNYVYVESIASQV